MNLTYKKATPDDIQIVTNLMLLHHEGTTFEGLHEENQDLLQDNSSTVLLAFIDKSAIGFALCSLRHDYVEGTNGGTIGYLEGIYILPDYRLSGIATSLLAMCEAWAKENGCKEFASDCELDNTDSIKFHQKTGFQEVNRHVCFVKEL